MTTYFHKSRDGRSAFCQAESIEEAASIFFEKHDMVMPSKKSIIDVDDALYLFLGYSPTPIIEPDISRYGSFATISPMNKYSAQSVNLH